MSIINKDELRRIIRESKQKAQAMLSPARCSPAPKWYSAEEMREYLRRNYYRDDIANDLSAHYAENLQRAYNKGWDMGYSKAKQENDPKLRSSLCWTSHFGSSY